MLTAQFYVGSRPNFDAWERLTPGSVWAGTCEHVTGVWEGASEHTAIVTEQFSTVRAILNRAAWWARLSGNACVLVTFDTTGEPGERPTDTAEWGARRVTLTWEASYPGYTIPREGSPYTFVREPEAAFIAVTVTPGGDVSPV